MNIDVRIDFEKLIDTKISISTNQNIGFFLGNNDGIMSLLKSDLNSYFPQGLESLILLDKLIKEYDNKKSNPVADDLIKSMNDKCNPTVLFDALMKMKELKGGK